ncbi:hypothetical protein HDU90_006345 [Geranomyces variabilis]|nr:hypothetical protein HDU90_006345 [Geranomyces variabilis]
MSNSNSKNSNSSNNSLPLLTNHLVLLALDLPALATLARSCTALRATLADPAFKKDWVVRRLRSLSSQHLPPSLAHLVYSRLPPASNAQQLQQQQSHDAFLSRFPYTLRLRLPKAFTADDDAMLLLLSRELALAEPELPLSSTHRDAILAIARCAFWNGLPQVANVFVRDKALCERVSKACDRLPTPTPRAPGAPKDHQPNPWKPFRRALYVRGSTDILRTMWATPPDLTVWGDLKITWVADLECALRNPACAPHHRSPVDTMAVVWDLAQETLPIVKNLNVLVDAAFFAGDEASINFLRAHSVPFPAGRIFQGVPDLAPRVSSALSGFYGEVVKATEAHASDDDSFYTDFWLARDRPRAWTTFFKHAATLPEFTGADVYSRVAHRIFCAITDQTARAPLVFQCQIDILKLLLAQNPPDALCVPFIFEGAESMPRSLNVIKDFALPFWPEQMVTSSARQAFQEWVRLSASSTALRRWTRFGSDSGELEDPPSRGVGAMEMQRRTGVLHRLADDARDAGIDLKSLNSATLRKLVRAAQRPSQLSSCPGSLLSVLRTLGETLQEDPTTFNEWLEHWARVHPKWYSRDGTEWIARLLELGFDVGKITPDYQDWCQHHGVPFALLAKHGSSWAVRLAGGSNLEPHSERTEPPGAFSFLASGKSPLERAPIC